jgi:hypothetical protein
MPFQRFCRRMSVAASRPSEGMAGGECRSRVPLAGSAQMIERAAAGAGLNLMAAFLTNWLVAC